MTASVRDRHPECSSYLAGHGSLLLFMRVGPISIDYCCWRWSSIGYSGGDRCRGIVRSIRVCCWQYQRVGAWSIFVSFGRLIACSSAEKPFQLKAIGVGQCVVPKASLTTVVNFEGIFLSN